MQGEGTALLLEEIPQDDVFDEAQLPAVVLTAPATDRPRGRLATVGVGVQVEAVCVERTLAAALVEVLARLCAANIKQVSR